MKIIFSTYETKEIGGSYLRSLSLAKGLAELKNDVDLWTSAKKATLLPKISYEENVKIIESIGIFPYRFRKGGYDPLDIIFRTIVTLFTKCDVFHSFNHRPAATIPGLVKSLISKTKWFVDWADLWGKGGIADRRNGPLSFVTAKVDHYTEQLIIKIASYVTPISDDLVKKATEIRKGRKGIVFLPIGCNVKDINPINKNIAKKKLKIKNKLLVYLYVGTYDEVLLAKMFIELNKINKNVSLLLLGPNIPNFYNQFRNEPQALKKIIHPGIVSREKLSLYLSAGDIMMMPFANKEINLGKFPNKLGDYLAAGRPILANPTGEVKKLLNQEKIGIFASENPKKFAETANNFLNNTLLQESLGKNARKVAIKLSWTSVAQQLEKTYLSKAK